MPRPRTPPPPPLPLVSLVDVTLRVLGEDAFPHTTWAFEPGQQWAVIGPTASGKSTFLQALLGEVPYCAGRIDYGLGGRHPLEGEFPPGAMALVSVDQHRALVARAMDYHQARWSPVEEREPVTVAHVIGGRRRRALTPLLRELAIEPLWHRAVGALSNGEMRKVLLARALVSSPRLLLLDNPFAGLDAQSRRHLHGILRRLMIAGTPVLLATARVDEIPSPITHLLCLEGGRVVLQGRRQAVLASRWVRALEPRPRRTQALPPLRWRPGPRQPGAAQPPLVEVSRATVTYDRVQILRGVSWIVRRGENWVLRGRNGSGKTTLISLITGDNPQAYANDVRLFGVARGTGESIWEIRERIGWLAPELQFHYGGEATCWEVVCSGLYDTVGLYRDSSRREARAVRRWMANLQVLPWADEPFGALSDGQQRLVLLARALVKEPPLLIFDEPCQGLDAEHRYRVLAILDQVARLPHTTVVYVTHHADEIPRSFGCELHLGRGRVLYRGPRRAR